MGLSKSRPSTDEIEYAAGVEIKGQNWKCPSCGAANENLRQICEYCRKPRPKAKIKDNETTRHSPSLSGLNYYLVFVSSSASSLVKTRISLNFDDHPVITIGRGEGNIVVIPDQEVSRNHASLSFDGDKLLLKDLKSSNGTFVYDGKGFQRISDSVEVRDESVLKFGNDTVVRLERE